MAVARVAGHHPDDPKVAFMGLACDFHRRQAEAAGWLVRPYDGAGQCQACLSMEPATLDLPDAGSD